MGACLSAPQDPTRAGPSNLTADDTAALRARLQALRDEVKDLETQIKEAKKARKLKEANELQAKRDARKQELDEVNEELSKAELAMRNNNGKLDQDSLDLHGQNVTQALDLVREKLKWSQRAKRPHLLLIVGKGNHCEGGKDGRKLHPAVLELLREKGLDYADGVPNEGCITVHLSSGAGCGGCTIS